MITVFLYIKRIISTVAFATMITCFYDEPLMAEDRSQKFLNDVLTGSATALGACVVCGVGYVIATKFFSPSKSSAESVMVSADDFGSLSQKRFSDFVGQEAAIEQANVFMEMVLNREKYKKLGARPPMGLLIEGLEGNGKRTLAQAIAGELNCEVIPVAWKKVLSDGADSLPAIVAKAKTIAKKEKVMIFIDAIQVEKSSNLIEVIFGPQANSRISPYMKLLQIMDDLAENSNVFFVATIDNAINLPSALLSPEYFGARVLVPLLSDGGREKIARYYVQRAKLAEDVALDVVTKKIAQKTAGFSALLIRKAIDYAAVVAGQANHDAITLQDCETACNYMRDQDALRETDDALSCVFSTNATFSDVIGQDEAVFEVKEFVDLLKQPDLFSKLGAKRCKGLLLDGPPGCGKTLIARAMAGEAGCCFIQVSGADFVQKYVGTGAMKVREIFSLARQVAKQVPVIIFIDEIDALGSRSSEQQSADKEYNNTIAEVLRQMDGFAQDDKILVVGATNYKDRLDEALLRPGRFDRKVTVARPLKEGREALLNFYLKKLHLSADIPGDAIAQEFAMRTSGWSGADIAGFTNEAAIVAARYGADAVEQKHFEEAYDRITLGLKNGHLYARSAQDNRRVACHEAGHALVGILKRIPVAKVSIMSRGDAAGVTMNKVDDAHLTTKSELMHEMMYGLGGFVAEQLLCGEETPGPVGDLRMVNECARSMVTRYGMGDGDLQGIVVTDYLAESTKQKIDAAVMNLVQKALAQTRALLSENKEKLKVFTEELLKKETMSIDEVCSLLNIQKTV